MLRIVLAAGALCVVAACGSNHPGAAPTKTVTVAPSPSVSWDLLGRRACEAARGGADLTAETDAKISAMPALNTLGDYGLIKAWCAKNYHD